MPRRRVVRAIATDSVEAAEVGAAGITPIVIGTMDDKRTTIVVRVPLHLPVAIINDRTRMVETEVVGIHPRTIQGLVVRVLLRRSAAPAAAVVVAIGAEVTVLTVALLLPRLTLISPAAMPPMFLMSSSCYCKKSTGSLSTGYSEHLLSAA